MNDSDSEIKLIPRNNFNDIQPEDQMDRTLKHLDKKIHGDDLVQKILILAITSSKVAQAKLPLDEHYTPVNGFYSRRYFVG